MRAVGGVRGSGLAAPAAPLRTRGAVPRAKIGPLGQTLPEEPGPAPPLPQRQDPFSAVFGAMLGAASPLSSTQPAPPPLPPLPPQQAVPPPLPHQPQQQQAAAAAPSNGNGNGHSFGNGAHYAAPPSTPTTGAAPRAFAPPRPPSPWQPQQQQQHPLQQQSMPQAPRTPPPPQRLPPQPAVPPPVPPPLPPPPPPPAASTAVARQPRPQQQQQLQRAAPAKVFVPFRPEFFSSEPVLLSGSWDDWATQIALPHDAATGEAAHVLELDPDRHGTGPMDFKFNAGGKWHLSRADAAAADGSGCVNNTTGARRVVRFSFPAAFAPPGAQLQVHLIGSFTGWRVLIPMAPAGDGSAWHADVSLTPGHHTFRFLILSTEAEAAAAAAANRVWDPLAPPPPPPRAPQYAVLNTLPVEALPSGAQCNALRVPAPAAFRLLYHARYSGAVVGYRFRGHGDGSFARARLHHVPDGRGLMAVHVPAPSADAVMEFSVSGATWEPGTLGTLSSADEDDALWGVVGGSGNDGGAGGNNRGGRASTSTAQATRDPPGAALYTAAGAGTWRLKGGALSLDDASQLAPLMLCTDLDGTLIEDGADEDWVRRNDDLTAAASEYWFQHLAPAGGVLVYNTGRSIGMVEGLLAKKAGVMPWPHAIITAVGTKIFLFDVATRRWVADPAYAHLLDEGWDLREVQELAKQLMERFPGAAKVTDDGSEHPHRLSLMIRADVLDEFMARWSRGLVKAGVEHQMVASIGGEWRYVDCIACNAGKGRAMAYLASKYGVALEDVVAAGDSGNDILMLGALPEGHHPAIVMSNSHPEVWDWLATCPPEERCWVYTPKAERAGGIVEGMRAIVADKLAQKEARQRQAEKQARAAQQARAGGGGAPAGALGPGGNGNGGVSAAAAGLGPAAPPPGIGISRVLGGGR